MKKIATLVILLSMYVGSFAQTSLTEAVDFHIKTVEGVVIDLFPLLDDQNKIVVIDFCSTG